MSALIIGGIAFMCGGAIGAAWFVATLQREKTKRKNKRKWYRGGTGPEPRKPLPPVDLATMVHSGERVHDPDPDALLFETEAAPNAEQPNVMGPYVWNTDQYVNGRNYGPSGTNYFPHGLHSGENPNIFEGLIPSAEPAIAEAFRHLPLRVESSIHDD